MSPKPKILRLGDWRIDPAELTLSDGRRRVHLQARTMQLLAALHRANGRVVSKDALSESVWGGDGASDELIARHVSMIRRALEDDARQPRYLETVPRIGYRLVQPAAPESRRRYYWIAAAVLVAVAVPVAWLALLAPEPGPPPGRLLASPRPLLDSGPFRADLAVSPATRQIAFIEGPNIDLAGAVVVHDLEAAVSRRLIEGLNRFPAFDPAGTRLAFFRDVEGCQLLIVELADGGVRHRTPCRGTVSSPPTWVSGSRLLYALDGGGPVPSRLMQQELDELEPRVLWEAPAGEQIRFPLAVGAELYALLRAGLADTLVEIGPDGAPQRVLYGDEFTRIRWLAADAAAQRLLLVKYDSVDRFALYESRLADGSLRLIGNRDAVQSAAYAPGDAGVLYAATDFHLRHQAYLRRADGLYRRVALEMQESPVPYTVVAPDDQVVAYLFNSGNGVELYRMVIPAGPRRKLLAAQPGKRYGFPAWFADESRIVLAAREPGGHFALIIDAASGRELERHELGFAAGPISPSADGKRLLVIRQGLGTLGVYVLERDTGALSKRFEVAAQWGEFSADGQQLYLVDGEFRFIVAPLSGHESEREVITHVGSATGWRVVDGTLFYACPGEPTPAAMLCEMNLQRRAVLPHPEVVFYPSSISVSKDRTTLTAPQLEQVSMELMAAPWAQPDRLAVDPVR